MAEKENVPRNPTPDSSTKVKGKKLDVQLPYLSSSGTVKTALDRIRQAAAPERVHLDFVNTILKMKGGSGAAVIPFLKKVGLVASDGSPTDLYKRFRNPSTGGAAIASAIKHGYKSLAESREYFYKLEDKELLNLIVEVTGAEPSSSTAKQILYTLKALKEFADFDAKQDGMEVQIPKPEGQFPPPQLEPSAGKRQQEVGLRLGYVINLNLPATTDQAVFNAIFRSLKEHLLSYGE